MRSDGTPLYAVFHGDRVVSPPYDNFTEAEEAIEQYEHFVKVRERLQIVKAYNSPTGISYWNVVDEKGNFIGKATHSINEAYKQVKEIAKAMAGI